MHFKRATSTSVADLHLQTVEDKIKRLAIDKNNQPYMALKIKDPSSVQGHAPILTVMSSAQDDFNGRYEIIREIGKGGFSTVYQCRSKHDGKDYAVKVVDLRPLRLRERFNPARLKREVDIMKRLNHPNIIQFVEVYEDPDHLMMVMEFCPGQELFDVILARKFFSEEDAKPIFAQITRAIYYLHSLNIIHRDIKPENVLISNIPDENGGLVAKLLDFGLSKNAAAGSAAKTFVGTPCYLAPEVEFTSKGLGGTYGLPADCWSLGAVLYVMLVARFPEFEQDMTGKVVVKLPPALFHNISNEAKDLIRSLMNTNPNARLTASGALLHPWLGAYRATPEELTRVAVATSDLSHHLQEEEAMDEEANQESIESMPEITASGQVVHHQAMVVLQHPDAHQQQQQHQRAHNPVTAGPGFVPDQLRLTPLLHLQRSIATCFEEAHAQYQEFPEVAAQVRRGAVLCRQQLTESTQMLRKVEQTAKEVLNMFPDLELAVEEEEPQLAAEFFNIVKSWITDLREQVAATQKTNKASMQQIQRVVEQSSVNLQREQEHRRLQQQQFQADSVTIPLKMLETLMTKLNLHPASSTSTSTSTALTTVSPGNDAVSAAASAVGDVSLNSQQVMELFLSLFSSHRPVNVSTVAKSSPHLHSHSHSPVYPSSRDEMDQDHLSPYNNNNNNNNNNNSGVFHPVTAPMSAPRHTTQQNTDVYVETVQEPSPRVRAAASFPAMDHDNDNNNDFEDIEDIDVDLHESHKQPHHRPMPAAFPDTTAGSDNSSRDVRPSVPPPSVLSGTNNNNNNYDNNNNNNCMIVTKGNAHHSHYHHSSSSNVHQKQLVDGSSSPRAAQKLSEALRKLQQVDLILEQLAVFWANTEVVLDLLTKKGQHVEQFIGFATKPRLMARFRERMEEYKRFWEGIRMMCSNYVVGVQTTNERQKMYGFLEKNATPGSGIASTGVDSFDSLFGENNTSSMDI